ncbi:MAG: tetratricopeptide repeat protein [Verrucomicrobia bacterium]|nr:tetratricopeptide repeat protein [Verrucomicrobiota bacterium]
MLTTKNRVGIRPAGILIVGMAWWLSGCTPAGPKALLDGERLLGEGQYEQAAQRLERAVQLIPDNTQAWNHLGLAYHRVGRLEDATRAYEQALALDRELASARFNLGCLDLERGDITGAIRELTAYVLVQPDSTAGWLKLGTSQLRASQTDDAEQSFRQALKIDAGAPEALNGLGLVQVQRRRYPEAYQHFQAATRAQPDYAPALRNAAVVAHQFLKNKPVALRNYQELLSLSNVSDRITVQLLATRLQDELHPPPAQPEPMQIAKTAKPTAAPVDDAKASERSGRQSPTPGRITPPGTNAPAAEAKPASSPPTTSSTPAQIIARPVQRQPPATASQKASTPSREPAPAARTEATKRPEPAVVVSEPVEVAASPFPRYRYRSLGDVRPGNRAAAERFLNEGYQAHTRYRFSEAIGAYQKATQTDPSFFEAHYNLGVAAYENGDLTVSLSAYETALAIQPDSLKARFNFASTLEEAGYPRDAADELEKLVAHHPAEVRVHSTLANLYARKLGDPKRARSHYLRVLELDPRHPEATVIRYWLEADR